MKSHILAALRGLSGLKKNEVRKENASWGIEEKLEGREGVRFDKSALCTCMKFSIKRNLKNKN